MSAKQPGKDGSKLGRSATDVAAADGGNNKQSVQRSATEAKPSAAKLREADRAAATAAGAAQPSADGSSSAADADAKKRRGGDDGHGGHHHNGVSSSNNKDFDIYQFLNDDRQELLRDPVLQQMTVVRYEGEIDHATGFFEGHGKMVSTLGYTYSGAFLKGLMHGHGRITWSDGTSYEGEFVNNAISGRGDYAWKNGDTYSGDVRLHVRHGRGKFYYKALDETYEGEWCEGLRHGRGQLLYSADGASKYEGEWDRDRRKGHGVMKYADGGVYDGEWLDDVRHGQGHMVWRSGAVVVEEYRGSWVNGTPSGTGVSTYIRPPQKLIGPGGSAVTTVPHPPTSPNSAAAAAAASGDLRESAMNTYAGEYLDGKRHGFGTFVYDDGSRYEGMWQANLKHGQGKYTSATGVVFVGQFADGNPTTPITDVKPETTVACPVPLYIRDVLAASETNEAEAMVAVQSVVSRNNGLLRRTFKYYASLETGVDVLTTPADWRASRAQGTMYLVQFLRMCSDCKLITQHATIVAIDRALLAFRDRHESTTSSAYLAGEQQQPSSLSPTKASSGAAKPTSVAAAAAAGAGSSPTNPGPSGGTAATNAEAGGASPVQGSEASPTSPTAPSEHGSDAAAGGRSKRAESDPATAGRRSTTGARGSSVGGGDGSSKYAAPWDRYRSELHNFVGELNFREFVEAIVRVAALVYRDPVFGSVANKVQLVLSEHINAFACQPANGVPLCRISRDNKEPLRKHLEPLRHCFDYYSRASAVSGAGFGKSSAMDGTTATASGPRVRDTVVTVRQLSLLLKDCGLLKSASSTTSSAPGALASTTSTNNMTGSPSGVQQQAAPRVSVSDVVKAVPFERNEAFSALMYKQAFIAQHMKAAQRQQQQLTGLVGGGGTAGGGAGGAGSRGLDATTTGGGPGGHGPRPPPSATPSHAPSHAIGPSDRQSVMSGPAMSNNLMATIHSTSNSIHSAAAMRDEEAQAAALAEAEAALASRLALLAKSRGHGGRSFRTSVAMDVELTFVEFVEALAAIAVASFKENTPTQRISAFMLNYVLPLEKTLPPV